MSVPVIDEDAEAGYWRARAERAEARAGRLEAETAALRAERDALNARVAELAGQMARLQESVTTLSGLLFGSSSEKGGSPSRGNGRDGNGRPAGAGRRGQRPGGPGHGRRDYAHLETGERVIDVDAGQRCCDECGKPFEFLGTEDSEQIDWQVKITRIVWRRRRYKRACAHRGPATVCAPPAARPVPKGLFTAGFLARLAYEKHVLGRPVHRIVQALAADGLEVAAGTLCGALKQVAPLIAPWAAAIAAHGRTAGHVHADETSWQVFEDIADKDGHRWWLWVFVTSETTVFVMDPSRSAEVAAGQLGIDREQSALEGRPPPGHLFRLLQGLSVAGHHRRRGPAVVPGPYAPVFPAGRGGSPRGARRVVRCVDRADRGAVPGAPRPGGRECQIFCARDFFLSGTGCLSGVFHSRYLMCRCPVCSAVPRNRTYRC